MLQIQRATRINSKQRVISYALYGRRFMKECDRCDLPDGWCSCYDGARFACVSPIAAEQLITEENKHAKTTPATPTTPTSTPTTTAEEKK